MCDGAKKLRSRTVVQASASSNCTELVETKPCHDDIANRDIDFTVTAVTSRDFDNSSSTDERIFFQPLVKNSRNITISLDGLHFLLPFNRMVHGSSNSGDWKQATVEDFELHCWWASVPGMIGQGNLCGPETRLYLDEFGINFVLGSGLLCSNCELKGGEQDIMFVLEHADGVHIDAHGFQYHQPTCSGKAMKVVYPQWFLSCLAHLHVPQGHFLKILHKSCMYTKVLTDLKY